MPRFWSLSEAQGRGLYDETEEDKKKTLPNPSRKREGLRRRGALLAQAIGGVAGRTTVMRSPPIGELLASIRP